MKKILVAEDNPVNRELIREILSNCEYEVVEACDGQEALDKINEATPDLVLLDIQMPVLDGYAVLRRIRDTHMRPFPCSFSGRSRSISCSISIWACT